MKGNIKPVLQLVALIFAIFLSVIAWEKFGPQVISLFPKSTQQMCADVAKETRQRVWYSEKADKCAIFSNGSWTAFDPRIVRPGAPASVPSSKSTNSLPSAAASSANQASSASDSTANDSTRAEIVGTSSLGEVTERFIALGLCASCADNAAQYYINFPESECGQRASYALSGDDKALYQLKELDACNDYYEKHPVND